MVQDIVNCCCWEQRGEFHVFNIDNQVKALPLFSENSMFSDGILTMKKKKKNKIFQGRTMKQCMDLSVKCLSPLLS